MSYSKITKLWGLLEHKAQWTLSIKGWLFLLLSCLVIFILILTKLQPFLVVSHPISAQILVVEGWLDEYAMKEAKTEFEQGNYDLILTTGEALGEGSVLAKYESYAGLAAAVLTNLGVPPEKIVTIPTPKLKKDRTAASALAVKNWLLGSSLPVKTINLYSYDAHSRRSWFIYARVLHPQFQVGILAYQSPFYDPARWWATSEGFRSVLSEAIAYLYAVLIWQFTG
ncbi:MAG: hypothetical protein VKJ02_10390 [Snowella sp.]|nr:hypothetical protein [Snowella sp.]